MDREAALFLLFARAFVNSDRGSILTEMTQRATMPTFHALHTSVLLEGFVFHSEKLPFLFYFFPSCLPVASSVLYTVF